MAWQFVRLKLRVTGRLLSSGSAWSWVGTVVVWVIAVLVGVGGGAAIAGVAMWTEGDPVWAVLVGAGVQALWIVVPVIATALDSTVDPSWFELLPLTASELSWGMLAAGMVGPGGLATVLAVGIGLGWGYWPGWWGLLLVPVVALLMTFVGVVSGRLTTSLLSAVLKRIDQAMLGPIVGLVMASLGLAVSAVFAGGSTPGGRLHSSLKALAITPGGAGGLALGDGRPLVLGAGLVWMVVVSGALAWWHGRVLARLQTRASVARVRRVRREGASLLGDGLARLVPVAEMRVAAAKEGRYLRRDPRLRGQLVGGAVTIVVFGVIGTSLAPRQYAPFVAVAVAWALVTSLAPNQFGVDAGSMWAYVVSPTNLASVLVGKNIMWGLAAAPLVVVTAVAGAFVAGSARYVAGAVLAAAAVALVWLAVGNMTSIFGAFPLVERNVFSTGPTGGRAIAVAFTGLAVSGALSAPIVPLMVVAIYFGEAWGATVAGLLSLIYAALLFRFGFHWAQAAVVERRFRLLDALDRP